MYLGQLASGRDNNFNLIRIVAAGGVLVSHAFPIALGRGSPEPMDAVTGLSLGWICVGVFFAISGFLITRSFDRKPHVTEWVSARIMRLYPALVVVCLLVAFVYGPVFTTLAPADYFGQPHTYTYVPRNLSLAALQYDLPGVFTASPYPSAINGSLWTLFHEIACYAMVLCLGVIGAVASRGRFALFLAIYVVGYALTGIDGVAQHLPGKLAGWRQLSLPFVIGMALYVWRDRVRLSWLLAAALAALAVVLHGTALFRPAFVGAIAYTTFVLAYLPAGSIRRYNELGDYSYGLYVYAFPTQQALVATIGTMTPLANIALALPISLLCAVLSWYWVEKPMLERRHAVATMLLALARRLPFSPQRESKCPSDVSSPNRSG